MPVDTSIPGYPEADSWVGNPRPPFRLVRVDRFRDGGPRGGTVAMVLADADGSEHGFFFDNFLGRLCVGRNPEDSDAAFVRAGSQLERDLFALLPGLATDSEDASLIHRCLAHASAWAERGLATETPAPQPPLVVYVDVDDTLVRSSGSKRIPMSAVIEHVQLLHRQGAILYCWSSGGEDYARRSASELGLAGCFSGYLPKPHVMIDDQQTGDWMATVVFHPNEAVAKDIPDLRAALAGRGRRAG